MSAADRSPPSRQSGPPPAGSMAAWDNRSKVASSARWAPAAAGVLLDLDTGFHQVQLVAQVGLDLPAVEPLAAREGPHEPEPSFQSVFAGGENRRGPAWPRRRRPGRRPRRGTAWSWCRKFWRSPEAWDAARETAMAVRSRSRAMIRLAAAADPTAPRGPVGCQPRSS